MTNLYKSNFNAGIISPRAGGRIDLAKYESGVVDANNFLPQPWGGMTRRPGTKYINAASIAGRYTRLIPFKYSTEQAYIIEAGHQYMRFYMNGGLIKTTDASTMFLAHHDGNAASIALVDSGPTGHTITVGGNCKIDASDGVFNQCVIFDGSSDYYYTADHANFNFATDKLFTIEKRVKFNAISGKASLYAQETTPQDFVNFYVDLDNSQICFIMMTGGTKIIHLYGTFSPVVDTWYHVAVIRGWGGNADSWAITVNGAALDTDTGTGTPPNMATNIYHGARNDLTNLIDFSGNHHIDVQNGCIVTRDYGKYAKSSIYFDGVDDALDIDHSIHWSWFNNTAIEWNIHFWVKFITHAGTVCLVTQGDDANNMMELYHTHGAGLTLLVKKAGVAIITCGAAGEITDTDWHHILFGKSADGRWGVYLDGVQVSYALQTETTDYASALQIGARLYGASDPFNGYINHFHVAKQNIFSVFPNIGCTHIITVPTKPPLLGTYTSYLIIYGDTMDMDGKEDECRISKDARQTATFTPPTVAYPLGESGGSSAYEIVVDYKEGDLADIVYTQSADVLYLTQPNYRPMKLERLAHDNWNYASISFDWPPFQDVNSASNMMGFSSAAVGAATCMTTGSLFDDSWVNSQLKARNGYMNIASVQNATNCSGTIIHAMDSTATTDQWQVAAWDDVRKYPSCVMFFEERLCYANTKDQPQTVWMSVSGDYENFNAKVGSTVADTDGCTYTISADEVNAIQWMVATKKLVLGTEGGIWMLSGNQNDGVTPSNILIRQEAAEAVEDMVRVLKLGNSVFFVERGGKTLNEFAYSFQDDAYKSTNVSILAENITRNRKIVDIALQTVPYKMFWVVLDDGKLATLTYMKEHDVIGWSLHGFYNGYVEPVAIIPGNTEDEVWLIVRRTIGASTVRYIERIDPYFTGENEADAYFVDSGLTYDGSPTSKITGLTHLTGETVQFLADGDLNTSSVVDSLGRLFPGKSVSKLHAGLPITSEIETLRLSNPNYQGKIKRISQLVMRLFETCGKFSWGTTSKTDEINVGTGLYTDDYKLPSFPAGYESDGKIYIRKTDTLPMTVLAVIPDVEMYK